MDNEQGPDNVVDLFGKVETPSTDFYCAECPECGQKSFFNYIMESEENMYMSSLCTYCQYNDGSFWIRLDENPYED